MAEFTSRLNTDIRAKAIVPVAKDISGVASALGQGVANVANIFQNQQKQAANNHKLQTEAEVNAISDAIAAESIALDFAAQRELDRAIEVSQAADAGQVDKATAEINLRSTIQTLTNQNPQHAAEIHKYLSDSGIGGQAFREVRQQEARQQALFTAETERLAAAQTKGYTLFGPDQTPEEAQANGMAFIARQQQQAAAVEESNAVTTMLKNGQEVSDMRRTAAQRDFTAAQSQVLAENTMTVLNSPGWSRVVSGQGTPEELTEIQNELDGMIFEERQRIRVAHGEGRMNDGQRDNHLAQVDQLETLLDDLKANRLDAVKSATDYMKATGEYALYDSMGPLLAFRQAGLLPDDVVTRVLLQPDGKLDVTVRQLLNMGLDNLQQDPWFNGTPDAPIPESAQAYALRELSAPREIFEEGTVPRARVHNTARQYAGAFQSMPTFQITPARAANFLHTSMGETFQEVMTDPQDVSAVLGSVRHALTGARRAGPGWMGPGTSANDTWESRVLGVFSRKGSSASPEGGLSFDEATQKFVWDSGTTTTTYTAAGAVSVPGSRPTVEQQQAMDTFNRALDFYSPMLVEQGLASDLNHARALLTGTESAPPLDIVGPQDQPQESLNVLAPIVQQSVLMQGEGSPEHEELVRLQSRLDVVEGLGDYNKLWNNSELNPDSVMHGVVASEMTLAELDQLEEAYGAEVQETNPEGDFATPMGRYQIVGTTRRELAQQMGLPPTTKFSPMVQDLMFERLVARRRAQAMNSNLTFEEALQQEWPGLKRG